MRDAWFDLKKEEPEGEVVFGFFIDDHLAVEMRAVAEAMAAEIDAAMSVASDAMLRVGENLAGVANGISEMFNGADSNTRQP